MKHAVLIITMLIMLTLSMCLSVRLLTADKPAEEPKSAPALNLESVDQIYNDMKVIRKLVDKILEDWENADK